MPAASFHSQKRKPCRCVQLASVRVRNCSTGPNIGSHIDRGGVAIVIFHPYALLGGSCDDLVVLTIFRHDALVLVQQLCLSLKTTVVAHAGKPCAQKPFGQWYAIIREGSVRRLAPNQFGEVWTCQMQCQHVSKCCLCTMALIVCILLGEQNHNSVALHIWH